MQAVSGFYQELVVRFAVLRNRQKEVNALQGFFLFAAVAFSLLVFVGLLETVFYFSSHTRTFLYYIYIIINFLIFSWFIGQPLFSRMVKKSSPGDIDIALHIGRHFPGIRDRLADAVQVYLKHGKNSENYSLELADESLASIFEETRPLNFKEIISLRSLVKSARFFAVAFLIFLTLFTFFKNSFGVSLDRLLNPSVEFADRNLITLSVKPAGASVVRGESLNLQVNVTGEFDGQPQLFFKNDDANTYSALHIEKSDDSSFVFNLQNIRERKTYYASLNGKRTSEFVIEVLDRPLVRSLQVRLNFPSYSKLGSLLLDENVGDISALSGTRVRLSGQLNKTVEQANLVFDGEKELSVKLSGYDFYADFTLVKPQSYHISLRDSDDLTNIDPIEYRLTVIEDQSPVVSIIFPGQDVDLKKDMILPLSIEAQDDFGVAKLRIGYSILEQGFEETEIRFFEIPIEEKSSDNFLVNYKWDMQDLVLLPEDVVTYFAEAQDNDVVTGPKTARSAKYRVRFPSIYEIYEEVDDRQEAVIEDLDRVQRETKELKETLDKVVQQMQRDPDLNWEEKQNVQEMAETQEQLREQLEKMQENLDQIVESMEDNDLVSPETLKKYRELQSLIEEMLTEEMRENLERLQESAEQLAPKQMKEAMENLQANQDDFLKGMERTLNLLKKLQAEQKLDEALRKTQDLQRRQEELNQKASESSGSEMDREKYAREQEKIAKDANDLEKSLEELSKKMSEFSDMPQEKVDEAKSELSQGDMKSQMQNAAQQFKSGQMKPGEKSGQKVSQGLQKMSATLQSAQEQMQAEQKKEIMQALRRSAHDMLQLSQTQEKVQESAGEMDHNSPKLGELAESQQDLASGLNRVAGQLHQLSQKTFFVTPELGKALAEANSGMRESLEMLESRKPGKSGKGQVGAMSGLNRAAVEMRQAMQSLSSASSGVGFQEMMQRMMGLSGQQKGINQQTQGMSGQQGGMGMAQQAAMQRLAAQQDAVRKSLQQLMKEAGGQQSDMLGDLGQVGKDMKDVVDDLMRKSAGPRTIERQQKILSRLLDAQRSMENRDYSQKRKAETGKEYGSVSPAKLPENPGQRDERLKSELLKALRQGYSKDYKDLIQKYFEALNRVKTGEGN